MFERLFLMFQTAQKRREWEKEVRKWRFEVIFKGIHNVKGLKNILKYNFALLKRCMKVLGNLVEAKLVSLLYYGNVYSNPLCWTGEQAVVFMDNIRFNLSWYKFKLICLLIFFWIQINPGFPTCPALTLTAGYKACPLASRIDKQSHWTVSMYHVVYPLIYHKLLDRDV